LDKALDLPVGLWPVRPNAQVTNLQRLTQVPKTEGYEGRTVISHHAFDRDSMPSEPRDGVGEEGDGRRSTFVGKDLRERQSSSIIGGHVDELKALPG
jgi:hypothetical protein